MTIFLALGWVALGVHLVVLSRRSRVATINTINPNAPCPACGHSAGKLRCVLGASPTGVAQVLVQHTCDVCGAKHYEMPVLNTEHVEAAEKLKEVNMPRVVMMGRG